MNNPKIAETTEQHPLPDDEITEALSDISLERAAVRTAVELGSVWHQAHLLVRVAQEAVVCNDYRPNRAVESGEVEWARPSYDSDGCVQGNAAWNATRERESETASARVNKVTPRQNACIDFGEQERVVVRWTNERALVSIEKEQIGIAIKFSKSGSTLSLLKQGNGTWCCSKAQLCLELSMPTTSLQLGTDDFEKNAPLLAEYAELIRQAPEKLGTSQRLVAKAAIEILSARLRSIKEQSTLFEEQ